MNSKLTKFALTAATGLALTLLACEDKEKNQTQQPTQEAAAPPKQEAAAPPPAEKAGESIKSVKIGTQTWMAENLNIETAGSKCYDNKPENCQKYGRLYDYEAAIKACPSGWHLPSKAELDKLIAFAGGEDNADGHLKAKSGWEDGGNGEDKFGFAALPGGYGSTFSNAGNYGYWWSSTKYDNNHAYYLFIYSSEEAGYSYGYEKKDMLYSIRCIKD